MATTMGKSSSSSLKAGSGGDLASQAAERMSGGVLLTCLLASAANMVQQADRVIMPIAIIPMSEEKSWGLMKQGWILSAFAVGYITVQPIAGWTSTKVAPLCLLWVAVLGCSSSTALVPLACSAGFAALIICRICLGLTEGFCLPAIFQLFATRVPPTMRATAFSVMVASGNVGMLLALLVCPQIRPWQWMFFGFGLSGLTWCLAVALSSRHISPTFNSTVDSEGEDMEALKLDHPSQLEGLDLFRRLVTCRPMLAICAAHFAQNWTNYTMNSWLPKYLHEVLGVEVKNLWLTAVPYLAMTISNVLAGRCADALISHRAINVLTVRQLATAVGLVGPAMCHLLFVTASTPRMAIGVVTIAYFLGGATSSGYMANHADISNNYAGLTFSISNTVATIPGIAAGPFTAWLLSAGMGWNSVFAVASFVNLLCAGIYYQFAKAHRVM